MSPYPAPSESLSHSAASPTHSPDSTPKNDHKLLIVVVILSIAGTFVVGYIIYLTLRVKRRQIMEKQHGPFTGRVITDDHPASQITPFGAGGPYSGMTIPRFKHNPGEDMRIAVRRPDGAWYFADSRVPFTPSGVTEIDVSPSPVSSRVSLLSSAYSHRPLLKHNQQYSSPSSSPPPTNHQSRTRNARAPLTVEVPIIKVPSPAKPRRPEVVETDVERREHQNQYDDADVYGYPIPPSPSRIRMSYKDPRPDLPCSPI